MTDKDDGPWEPATEHDDGLAPEDSVLGEDPPTMRATLAQQVRARAARSQPAGRDRSDGVVVLATGGEAERVRKLCQVHGLAVPVMTSVAELPDNASPVIVIGEPPAPTPERVVHVVRPTLPEDLLLPLVRAVAAGRTVAAPPAPSTQVDPSVADHVRQLSGVDDRGALERLAIDAITACTTADRAYLWCYGRQPTGGIVGWCALTGEPVHATPAGDDPRFVLDFDDPGGKPQARLLVQPVIGTDHRVHAVLVAARRWRRTEFVDTERAALGALAAAIAPAIERVVAPDARRARATSQGLAAVREASEAAVQSAIVAGPRTISDSRPPPVTARAVGDSRPPPTQRTADSVPPPTSPEPVSPAGRAATPSPVTSNVVMRPGSDASASASGLRAETPAAGSPVVSTRAASEPSVTGELRSRKASDPGRARRAPSADEPRDIAVVASAPENVARVQKLARKARLEVSVLARVDDAPPYYRVVTLGEAPNPADAARIAYAARASVSDDMLVDLLVGLQTDRAPNVLVAAPPQSAAEARRIQLAIASARKLVSASDLADAETIATSVIRELVDADRAYCLYYDAAGGSLWSETRERDHGDDRRAIAGITGWVARAGKPVSAPRASADPRWLGPLDDPEGDPNSQLLAYPIVAADRRVLGVMVAVRRPKRPGFTELDITVFERFVALAAPQFEHIELARDATELLGEGDVSEPERPAPPSPLQRLARRAATLPRWLFALAGAAAAFALAALARC